MINKEGLVDLVESDSVALTLFTRLSKRKRNAGVTTVPQVMKLTGQTRREWVILLLKQMDALGLGKFVVGRGGYESRFEWSVKMTMAAAAALKLEDFDVADLSDWDLEPEEADITFSDEDVDVEDGHLRHSFHLRKGLTPIVFELPSDLSPAEAARLARFVRSLPYDAEAEPI
ncbi:hypothetical protein [Variovorax guangxiensis]|uniref:Uncharacterized protein n=1 Tax=Variovorax guangxiensis TaxID=1775474 RepID=A0A502E020_9BURK|nr:hypothetical protein [Variovorax guangxiensis]RYF54373.1 MAG: hypothetical protein EOO27_23875 [Comamonadaceae bacterium]TPG26534.1 hypothetical protein EAH83_01815 [Variovorax ginsengisoli]TPG30259.1 hypothetical protein EAH82_01815 [Variovorax guangxiensis]